MKRYLSILLIVALLPGLLAVPAMGAEAVPASVYDLLSSGDFSWSDSRGNSGSSARSSIWVEHVSFVEFSWPSPISTGVDGLELAVECSTKPASVLLWDGYRYVSFNYTGTHSGVHFYTYAGIDPLPTLWVRVTFDSPFVGTVGLRSMHGFLDRAIPVNSCQYFTNVVIASPTSGWSEHIVNDYGTALLPVASHWNGPYDYIQEEFMDYAECFYKVSSPTDRAQSVSYLVYTVGEIDNVGVRLEKSDGSILYGVPSVVDSCGDSQIVVDLSVYSHRCKVYRITADLQGYDLSDCVVVLSYEVKPVAFDTALPYFWGFYSQFTACAFLPLDSPQSPLDRFIGWLSPHLNDIERSLDKIADAMDSTSPGSEDYADKMQDASDRLDNAAGVLDSVARPSVDSINSNLSGLVDSSSAALAIAPLSAIFSSSTLFPVFLLAFSLALAAYVLFGKR